MTVHSHQRAQVVTERAPAAQIRRFQGPNGTELFLHCRPAAIGRDVGRQVEDAYAQLGEALASEGASLDCVVQETVFFRAIRDDLPGFLKARERHLLSRGSLYSYRPATIWIQQAPVDPGVRLEISATAVVPRFRSLSSSWNLWGAPPCGCDECFQASCRVSYLGNQKQLFAGNICGEPTTVFDEAYSMFVAAEGLLRQEALDFRSVARTWIYLRHMEQDYAELNRARRTFFQHAGVAPPPASTGIQGAPFAVEHRFAMSFYAIHSPLGVPRERMTTPTLNEAPSYGADFSRGTRVVEANRAVLIVSGTASVDEEGRSAHVGDFGAQAERMLLNIRTLLEGQRATPADVVSGITYLKRPADAPRMRRILARRGFTGFPNALVQASVCRPELLCEMEVVAALPLPGAR
ncbi:MAG: hypothetical protein HY721_11180 [Planctomycetes bacterium]|nr:hypothetical protein [Planctomycetota bacterium]